MRLRSLESALRSLESAWAVICAGWIVAATKGWINYAARTEPIGADAVVYFSWATALNGDYGLGLHPGAGFYPDYWPPGFFYVLALFLRVFGDNWQIYALFGASLAALSVWCVVRLAVRCGMGRAALAVGLAYALSGSLLLNAITVGSDVLGVTLFMVGILLLVVSIERGWLSVAVASGIMLGLASLTRSNHLLFVVFLMLVFALRLPKREPWMRQAVVCLTVATVCVLITVAPWIARNYQTTDRLSPVSSNGAINFLIGNQPFANGGSEPWTEEEERVMVDMGMDRALELEGHPSWCCTIQPKHVLAYNLTNPGFVVRNTFNKLHYLLFTEEMGLDPLFLRTGTVFSLATHTLFWGLVVVGMMRFWRAGSPAHLVIIAIWAYGVLSVLPFFGDPRFRVSFAPAVFILLAAGMQAVWTRRNILSSMRESLRIWSLTAIWVGVLFSFVLWASAIGTELSVWVRSGNSIEQFLVLSMHAVACLGVALAFIKTRVEDRLRTR